MQFLFNMLSSAIKQRQRVTTVAPGPGFNPGMVKGQQFGQGSATLWTPDFHLIQTLSDAGNGTLVPNGPRALSSTAAFVPLRMFGEQQMVGTLAQSTKYAPLVDRASYDVASRR